MKTWLTLLLLAAGGYAAVIGALYLLQGSLIFHPQQTARTPEPSRTRPFTLAREAVILHGWTVNPGHDGPLVVYFGGNAEEMSRLTPTFARLPATSVLVNYRGYGRSGGTPSAAALLEDAAAVTAAARERLGGPERRLLLFGRSLGSGLAALTAARTGADGLILLSPYRRLADVARHWLPFVPVDALLRHRIDATRARRALPERVLVLYATDDAIIPAAESRALVDLIDPPPRVVTFAGGHNVPLEHPGVWPAIVEFVERRPPL